MPSRVAFLPGAAGAGEFWSPVAARLPDHWQTELLSWPGAGAQPHDPAVASYDDLVTVTAAAIADGSDVVAQSMGGIVAVGLAVRYPDKIRRLVLVATSGGVDVASLGAQDWRDEYAMEFPDAATWVTAQRVDHTGVLATINAPTCLIWGDADPISPLAVGRQLHAALPSSTLHVVPGGTHTLARDEPDTVAGLIVEHLS